MNYLHSPSRYHNNMNSKSPISLFESPSLTTNRFSDQYQALSCESPPPNFDDLQTPMPPQRRTLDWGTEMIDKATKTTPKSVATTELYKRTPERPSTITPERYSISVNNKSSVERIPLNGSPQNGSPLKKYELSPFTKKNTTPEQLENTSPLDTSRSTPHKYTTWTEQLYKTSPLDQQIEDVTSRNRRPLEYISSPVRNTVPQDTISPRKSTSHHTSKEHAKTPNFEEKYQRRRSLDQTSTPIASPVAQEDPVMYRSPVYSNSSYKPTVKRSKSVLEQSSPSAPLDEPKVPHDRKHLTISPLASRATQRQPSNVTPRSPVIRPKSHDLPHYMRTTESYQSRLQAQVDHKHHTKLHKTKTGGIIKRARTPQQFRSTTKINAIDDIKNEMSPEDVYIPLAARVKLFEKGLGNGANSRQRPVSTDSANWTHRLTKAKSPYLYTRERSAVSSHHCHEFEEQPSSLNDRLMQEQAAHSQPTETKRLTKRSRQTSEDSTRIQVSKRSKHAHVKPFHFATDDRAARYQETFRAKLSLWKEKADTDNKKTL